MMFSPEYGLCSEAQVRGCYPQISLPEILLPSNVPGAWYPVITEDGPDGPTIPQYRFEAGALVIGRVPRQLDPAPVLAQLKLQIQAALRYGCSRESIVTLLD